MLQHPQILDHTFSVLPSTQLNTHTHTHTHNFPNADRSCTTCRFPSGPDSVFSVDMDVALCADINIVRAINPGRSPSLIKKIFYYAPRKRPAFPTNHRNQASPHIHPAYQVFHHRSVSTPMFGITLHTSMTKLSSHKLSFTPTADVDLVSVQSLCIYIHRSTH